MVKKASKVSRRKKVTPPTPHRTGVKPPNINPKQIPNHVALVMDGNGRWAKQKGLFTQVYENTEELDAAVKATAEHLCTYNTEAMTEMKKVFWKGTEDWNTLLAERAEISGRLVLSEVTKEKLKDFK